MFHLRILAMNCLSTTNGRVRHISQGVCLALFLSLGSPRSARRVRTSPPPALPPTILVCHALIQLLFPRPAPCASPAHQHLQPLCNVSELATFARSTIKSFVVTQLRRLCRSQDLHR